MGFAISQLTTMMVQNVQSDCEYQLTQIMNTLQSLSMKQQSIVEEQMQAVQIYMEQHKDEDGAVDQSAIEYVNSSAFNAKYNAMLQQIQVKEQALDIQKQQIETKQKMYSSQVDGWEKNTTSNIEKTFKYGN